VNVRSIVVIVVTGWSRRSRGSERRERVHRDHDHAGE
jgi:hypothetical protein